MNEREEEKERGFKVEDRRRFSADGDLKPEHQGEEPQAEPPPAEAGGAHAGIGAQSAVHAEPPPEINFAAFVMSLSTQALVHLGEIPDPATNRPERDLPAAQHLIDILGMLAEKTRNNLDHDEESLLRSILFDLRMKYVETARHNPR